jgi:hypothetical protein
VPLFTDDVVWAPDTKWSEAVIVECERFPKGTHDDYVDAVSQFLLVARERGWLVRADEMSAALDDEAEFQSHGKSVADAYGIGA